MSARTDALMSQQETGKTTAFIILRYGRLSPGASYCFNAFVDVCFLSFPKRIFFRRRWLPLAQTLSWCSRDARA
jgi:hypothetical protein